MACPSGKEKPKEVVELPSREVFKKRVYVTVRDVSSGHGLIFGLVNISGLLQP